MQELDRVDEKEDVDRSLSSLKVLEDVLRKELDDIDEDISRGYSVLGRRDRDRAKVSQSPTATRNGGYENAPAWWLPSKRWM